ncbi:MAG: ATP-grasp domain-containing protein [Paludibacteraceae bacterium]|nr:ATP-grasp domain-containing protein [Paludibacteraceae bacterium]
MSSIKGKKILILGGNALTIDIVNAAHALGLYTIVTDWNTPDKSPAKLVADEYWMDSLSDIENLKRKIEAHHVSGIITGFSDSYLPYYARLCKVANLPCYATEEVFEQTLDKAQFKQLCQAYDVPVVPEYNADTFTPAKLSPSNRVIIKPVDNSGSRGIVICDNPKEWQVQLAYSKSFSASGHVLIEQYMECDDISFEYKIQDGEIILSSICDRYIYKTAHFGSVTKELIYPSNYTDRYLREVNDRVIAMFKAMHLQNGVLFMQAFADNEGFYFYEMGYRLSGGRHFIFTENQNNSNAAKELCHFAVTGSMADYSLKERNNPNFKDLCCQISILCKGDTTIYSIKGLEELRSLSQIIDLTTYYHPGETVGKEGTTAQIFARVHIVVRTQKELTSIKQHIFQTLSVQDKFGNQLIIKTL